MCVYLHLYRHIYQRIKQTNHKTTTVLATAKTGKMWERKK